MASTSPRRGFFSLLNLLLALFLAASLVSAGEGADIASALLAAADGDTSVDDTDFPSSLSSSSSSSSSSQSTGHTTTSWTNAQAAGTNSTKKKGYDAATNTTSSSQTQSSSTLTTSTRRRTTSVMGMAAVVPICAIFITLFVVAMRLYLNRIEEEEEYMLEKRPWQLDANDSRFEIGAHQKEMGYTGAIG